MTTENTGSKSLGTVHYPRANLILKICMFFASLAYKELLSQPKLRYGLKGLPLNNKGHSSSLSQRKFRDFWNSVPGIGDEDHIYVSYGTMISQLSS